ncbi:MAG: anti-sigma factor [Anaerolineae bacterium]|nr:anti-sigma factor [Anaerolineae bacterium]
MDEHFEELFPFYALGALSDDEKAQVEAYVAVNRAAQGRLVEACQITSALPYAARPARPSPQVKLALLNRINAEKRQPRLQPAPFPAVRRPSFWERLWQTPQWNWAMPALVGLSLLLALLAGSWAVLLNGQISQVQQQNLAFEHELSRQNETLAAVLERMGPFQQENAALKNEVGAQKAALAKLNEAVEPLQAENSTLKQELAAQAEQLAALDQAASQPPGEPTVSAETVAALQQELTTQREQLAALDNQVAQLQAVNTNLGRELVTQRAVMAEVTSPDVQAMKLAGTETIPQAHGQLIANPGEDTAVLIVSGLPPLQPGLVYQFWLVQNGQLRRAGEFTVDTSGLGLLQVAADTAIGSYEAMGISVEPANSSGSSSNEMIMLGNLSS